MLRMTPDARQKGGNLYYAITYNVFWANQKNESFVFHWLRALAISFPGAILSGIAHHFTRFVDTSITKAHMNLDYSYKSLII